jgi:RNase adaptor protein for sRNA GlmZ degradation
MAETPFTASASSTRDSDDHPSNMKDVVIVIGPSGAGKRTAIGVLEDLFDYCAVTKVTLEQLLPLFDVVPMNRLLFHLLLTGRGPQVLIDGYGTLVDECVQCFHQLQRRCRRFQILFLYCVQEELANRQTVGFHPLLGLCGTLKAAIFKECEMLVQLF